jgi:hypothetical protein
MNHLILTRTLSKLTTDKDKIQTAVETIVSLVTKPSAAALFVHPLGEGVYSVPGDEGRTHLVHIEGGRVHCQAGTVVCCDTDESPACWHYRAVVEWMDEREFKEERTI